MNSSAAAVLIAASVTATARCAKDAMLCAVKCFTRLKERLARSTSAAEMRKAISLAVSAVNCPVHSFLAQEIQACLKKSS